MNHFVSEIVVSKLRILLRSKAENVINMAAVKDFNFESVDIVIMDNADLYMNRGIYLKARESHALVFISMKSYCGLDPGNSGEYKIDYEKDTNTIRLRRLGV